MKTNEPNSAQIALLWKRLDPGTESCFRLYRRCRELHFYLCVWQEYTRALNANLNAKTNAPRLKARYEVENIFCIDKKLFYKMREILVFLAEEEAISSAMALRARKR